MEIFKFFISNTILSCVKKCPVCNEDIGLYVDKHKSVWYCNNEHKFINNKGEIGKRIYNRVLFIKR